MEAKATAKYIRVSAQKARLVIDLIRGKKAGRRDQHFAVHQKAHLRADRKGIAFGDR